jgi:hypothetical protein
MYSMPMLLRFYCGASLGLVHAPIEHIPVDAQKRGAIKKVGTPLILGGTPMIANRLQVHLIDLVGVMLLAGVVMHLQLFCTPVARTVSYALLSLVAATTLLCILVCSIGSGRLGVPVYLRFFMWFYLGFSALTGVAYVVSGGIAR